MTQALYDELAIVAAALAHPKRLRALNLLFQGPKPIDALAALLEESPANTAAHMKVLRDAGLVVGAREGKYVFQHVSHAVVTPLVLGLRSAAEEIRPAAARQHQQNQATASTITMAELESLMLRGRVLLIDLRPREEYEKGRLPGAGSLPLAALPELVCTLPRRRRVLVYCRGKYCPNAIRGVAALKERGFRAERLAFGVPEWIAEGRMPVSELCQ